MMINRELFDEQFRNLAVFFDYSPQNISILVKEYFKIFEMRDETAFLKACDHLKENFERTGYKKFPSVNDIKNAFTSVISEMSIGKGFSYGNEPKATEKEFKWFFACIELIVEYHKRKLRFDGQELTMNHETTPVGFDAWIQAGKPPTWSLVYDHMQANSEKFYKKAIGDTGDALAKYYYDYFKMLRDGYKQQTGKTYEAKNDIQI